jgi:MIP family channel proteins
MDASLDRRIVAEIVGTFGFFFAGFSGLAAAVVHKGSIDGQGQALCFGLGLTAMIFAFGHVSGGHYNPAVTFGLACGGRFPVKEVPFYWAAQLAGGVAAAGLVRGLWTSKVADQLPDSPAPGVSDGKAFLIEAVATFLFLLVISSVATDSLAPWNGVFAPVAIGGFIFTAATWAGPYTSGSFNPARSLAPSLVTGTYTSEWVFLLGPLVGGALGGAVFTFIRRPGTFLAPHPPPKVIERRWADEAIDIPEEETEYEREAALARRGRHSHGARS